MNNKPLIVKVFGGVDTQERILLAETIATNLCSTSYTNVAMLHQDGEIVPRNQPSLNIYDIVKLIRPSLFDKEITIATEDTIQHLDGVSIYDSRPTVITKRVEEENARLQERVLQLENAFVDIDNKIRCQFR